MMMTTTMKKTTRSRMNLQSLPTTLHEKSLCNPSAYSQTPPINTHAARATMNAQTLKTTQSTNSSGEHASKSQPFSLSGEICRGSHGGRWERGENDFARDTRDGNAIGARVHFLTLIGMGRIWRYIVVVYCMPLFVLVNPSQCWLQLEGRSIFLVREIRQRFCKTEKTAVQRTGQKNMGPDVTAEGGGCGGSHSTGQPSMQTRTPINMVIEAYANAGQGIERAERRSEEPAPANVSSRTLVLEVSFLGRSISSSCFQAFFRADWVNSRMTEARRHLRRWFMQLLKENPCS